MPRYAFWRDPTGRPHRANDDRHAPTHLLASIGRSATLRQDGSISRPITTAHQDAEAVHAALMIVDSDGKELSESVTSSIASDATKRVIRKQGGGKPILATAFIAEANKLAAVHFGKPVSDFVLVSSLSVEDLPANRIHGIGCIVTSLIKRGKFAVPDTWKDRIDDPAIQKHLDSSMYLKVKVRTSGRSVFEATDRALDSLNCLRGLWTLFSTYGQWTMRFGTTRVNPIGVIHTGPLHTLHRPDGSPATDVFWYEPTYYGDRKLFNPKEGWEKLDKNRKRAIRALSRSPFQRDVERLIIRYAEALDETNLDVAFIRMWSILEKITDTVGARYDDTIERAIWIFRDYAAQKEKLQYLRMRRNQYVHAARVVGDSDHAAYLVKSFVDPHLVRLIYNDFRVKSLAEYGQFLALPTNMNTLEKRHDQIRRAIKVRTPSRGS